MLDAAGYLSRVVAPGHYYALAFKRPEWTGLQHRFYPQSDVGAAANWLRYISASYDVWVGVAAFRDAAQTGVDHTGQLRYKGPRTQANAEALKCFWYDADIARPGDGKAADRVWQNDAEATRWLAKAHRSVGLPIPNTWIRSGYGIHFYWVLDTAIPADQWLPYGQAFRDLLSKAGARGDIGISADSARIMRLPETLNHKVPASPAHCFDMTPPRVPTKEFPTGDFLKLLAPLTTGRNLGAPPPSARITSQLNANAQAGIEHSPPFDFDKIAAQCPQVARTLAEEGEHDGRMLWHHMVNLAYACRNQDAAHRLGRKHPKYSPAGTDAKWAQTEREHAGKDFGAPLCSSIDSERTGICGTCPHNGKIKSPYSLGIVAQSKLLPSGYRQASTTIEVWKKNKWVTLADGVILDFKMLRIGNTYRLIFVYVLSDEIHRIEINESDIHLNANPMRQALVQRGISVDRINTNAFADFLMAWITELRNKLLFTVAPTAFGWVSDEAGNYLGISVAGTFYLTDGTQTPAQPGDRKIGESYQPQGDLVKWQAAAKFVTDGRPELQLLVAVAFAAPLMEFVGESAIVSVWSMKSGARKTSAFRIGTSVWCNPITGMSAIRDTINSVQHSLGETRIMPVYWDEIHAAANNKDQVGALGEMIFNITQGRGRARLDSKIEQRDVGYWRTMMAMSANRPIGELIEQDRTHTNAGTLRIFEYQMEPHGKAVLEASTTVAQCERNYGHAGRIFVQWVVQHIEEVKNFIDKLRKQLGHDLKTVDPNERFHVATMLGIVAGAYFANRLKIMAFDVKAIYRFLLDKILAQRTEREEDNPIDDEQKHLLQTFERFVSDLTDELVVTQSFSPVGRRAIGVPDRVKIIKRPGPQCSRAMIHIGLNEGQIRFDHSRYKEWCQYKRLSAKAELELMQRLWPLRKTRAVLGIGTDWSSGAKVYYHILSLNSASLQHHLDWGTPNPDPSNVVPLPVKNPRDDPV